MAGRRLLACLTISQTWYKLEIDDEEIDLFIENRLTGLKLIGRAEFLPLQYRFREEHPGRRNREVKCLGWRFI